MGCRAAASVPQVLDVADGLFQELADVVVVQVIDDLPALTPTDNKPKMTENAKLMRDSRGLHPDGGRELVDRGWTRMQLAEDAQPTRSR